jgi:hypothetical protein
VPNAKPKPKLIRTSVFLTQEQHARLAAVHDATDVPVAALVRRGVDLILAQYETSSEVTHNK